MWEGLKGSKSVAMLIVMLTLKIQIHESKSPFFSCVKNIQSLIWKCHVGSDFSFRSHITSCATSQLELAHVWWQLGFANLIIVKVSTISLLIRKNTKHST